MVLDGDTIEHDAELLWQAWSRSAPVAPFAEGVRPRVRQEAFRIQDRLASRIGEAVVGWKVGAATAAIQKEFGYDGPTPGRIFASRLFKSGDTIALASFCNPKVECELSFRFIRDFTPGDTVDRERVADSVEMILGLEIGDSRFIPPPEGRRLTNFDDIADNGSCGGFVAGPSVADWRGIDVLQAVADARFNGGEPLPPSPLHYRNPPLESALYIVEMALARGLSITAGSYVATGSLVLPGRIEPGRFAAKFGSLGAIEATFS